MGGIVAVSAFVGGAIAIIQPRIAVSPQGGDSAENGEVASQTGGDGSKQPPDIGESAPPKEEDPAAPETPDPKLYDFPHQRLQIADQVQAGSEFGQFRNQLQQAIKNRDAAFIESILPPDGLAYGFGLPITSSDMDLSDPNGWFWENLEKMLVRNSCELDGDYPPTTPGEEVWICPNVTKAFYRQYPPPADAEGVEYEYSTVIVLGQGVNVRAAPSVESPVVGILSNELVKVNQPERERLLSQNLDAPSGPIQGWTPVILPNQVKGYVFNRYAYQPLDERALFEKIDGQWQMVRVLAGD